ncbi:LOW QUALITY PROTEIN: photoreceptor ankyrin repeat protein [Suncus etruscus]|uniref:LOW QUALITY PROTEIN: photoreceptor ankyrin repeat protein n=1 Tax=Suncus etruscus TaxID=109475 RepID=UPI002110320B|nr:LOW QUALITY PROTEIN: photoreceptor ankyrin repeat protein [Suncus etruscus]
MSPEEVTQVDSNGQTGFMMVCHHGFGSIMALPSQYSSLDVNQQNKEGDIASLMLASQAGARHVTLVRLLLNYFPGLNLKRQDQHGLTALMKAVVQDRGQRADLRAINPTQGKAALEWAVLTDNFHTVCRIGLLQWQPHVEQLNQHFQSQWPALVRVVALVPPTPSLLEQLLAILRLSFVYSQEGDVRNHLVTITNSLASPFFSIAYHTHLHQARRPNLCRIAGAQRPAPARTPGDPPRRLQGPPHRRERRMWEARSRGRAGPGRAGAWAAARGVGAAREGPTPQPDEGERRRVGELGNRKRFMRREWWSRARQEGAGTASSGSGPFAARGGPRGASSERPVVGSRPRRAPSPAGSPGPEGPRASSTQEPQVLSVLRQSPASTDRAAPLFSSLAKDFVGNKSHPLLRD